MKGLFFFFLCLALVISCSGGGGIDRCATDLNYVPNIHTSGQHALTNASVYYAKIMVGDEFSVTAKLETGSSDLVINESDYLEGGESRFGKKVYVFENQEAKSLAINAMDKVDVACAVDFSSRFNLTAKSFDTPNILGLAFGDSARLPHEAKVEPFFNQLVNKQRFNDVISLALCGSLGTSRVVLGGIDDRMNIGISKFIPIIEKSSYVVPALALRRADNKKLLGTFPAYDPETKSGRRTIIDSGTSFNMLPIEMAVAMAKEVVAFAKDARHQFFPEGFFRTERSTKVRIARFPNMIFLRQYPSFEITFYGSDGKTKALELSPLHYFKEMDLDDPLIRTFAIRETDGEVVLGQPFIENHYIVFDRSGGRIGFGNIDVACAP